MGAAFSHASPTDVSARKALSACSYLLRPYVHWEEFGRHLQVEVITRDRSSPESRVWELFLHCPAPCLLLPERECSTPSTGCNTQTHFWAVLLCLNQMWKRCFIESGFSLGEVEHHLTYSSLWNTPVFSGDSIIRGAWTGGIFQLLQCKFCVRSKHHSSYYIWKVDLKGHHWVWCFLKEHWGLTGQKFPWIVPFLPESSDSQTVLGEKIAG